MRWREAGRRGLLYRLPLSTTRGEVDAPSARLSSRSDAKAQAMQDVLLRPGRPGPRAAADGLVLQRQLLRPLSRLNRSIRALGGGKPSLPVTRRDELGVAAAFNRMADQLG